MKLFTAIASLIAAAALGTAASAQCNQPDQLQGACCAPTQLNVPNFPSAELFGSALRYDACSAIDLGECVEIKLGAPQPTPNCSVFTSSLEVVDCSGTAVLEGTLRLDYARTWLETGPGGLMQVWRYLVKVDMMRSSTGVESENIIPSSLDTYDSIFYHGYVDYARRCQSGVLDVVLGLYHGCDRLQHQPGLSFNPGVFDPETQFAIVATSNPAQVFVPNVFPAASQPVTTTALRTTSTPVCQNRQPGDQGQYLFQGEGCLCPASLNSQQFASINMRAGSVCGSDARTLNVTPNAPWPDLLTISLGNFSDPNLYPGDEQLRVDEGLFLYRDACAESVDYEVFYGVETKNGFPAQPLEGAGQLNHLVDLAGNWINPVNQPLSLPAIGAVLPTRHLIHLTLD